MESQRKNCDKAAFVRATYGDVDVFVGENEGRIRGCELGVRHLSTVPKYFGLRERSDEIWNVIFEYHEVEFVVLKGRARLRMIRSPALNLAILAFSAPRYVKPQAWNWQ